MKLLLEILKAFLGICREYYFQTLSIELMRLCRKTNDLLVTRPHNKYYGNQNSSFSPHTAWFIWKKWGDTKKDNCPEIICIHLLIYRAKFFQIAIRNILIEADSLSLQNAQELDELARSYMNNLGREERWGVGGLDVLGWITP